MEISDQSISVVIQGPVVGSEGRAAGVCTSAMVLESVRWFLPKAEIILSTWEGTDYGHLSADIVVTSKDPGAFPFNDSSSRVQYNNLNRMLVSTQAGLARCTRPFAIKLRTDTPLVRQPDFAAITPVRAGGSSTLFERRVLVPNIYTRHPLKRPVLFHLSDLVHFGTTTDLRTLWCVPLVNDPEFTRWNRDRFPLPCNAYPELEYHCRCAPEQYLVESLARRIEPGVFLTHPGDGRVSWLFLWLRLLATHFVIQPYERFFAALPDRMAEHAHAFDLFAGDDLPWLELWGRTRTPLGLRVKAMVAYSQAQSRYMPPRRYRLIGRAIRRILRRFAYQSTS